MDFDYLDSGILGGEEEEEGSRVSTSASFEVEDVDVEKRQRDRSASIYENFVSEVVDDFEEVFSVEDVVREISPPYSSDEIESTLEYAVDEGLLVKEDDSYTTS